MLLACCERCNGTRSLYDGQLDQWVACSCFRDSISAELSTSSSLLVLHLKDILTHPALD